MNKKTYIKPEIEVVLLEVQSQMMTTSPGTKPGFSDQEATEDGEILSNERRGTWGNLWE